jgi:hypothetical protein
MKGKVLISVVICMVLALGFAFAQEGEKEEGIKVAEAAICTSVENLTPQGSGDSFPADVGKLYCFTKITGAKEETKVKHCWYHGDNLLAEVELAVKSASWRTKSSKNIEATRKGAWKVEIKDADDNLLKTLNFTIE